MAVIGGDIFADPKGRGPDSLSPSMPGPAKGDAASESTLLAALAYQEKLLLHVSDQVSSLARMRLKHLLLPSR